MTALRLTLTLPRRPFRRPRLRGGATQSGAGAPARLSPSAHLPERPRHVPLARADRPRESLVALRASHFRRAEQDIQPARQVRRPDLLLQAVSSRCRSVPTDNGRETELALSSTASNRRTGRLPFRRCCGRPYRTGRPGDTIPLGRERTLRVVDTRLSEGPDGDTVSVLVVAERAI
jgi:hypothetical protein